MMRKIIFLTLFALVATVVNGTICNLDTIKIDSSNCIILACQADEIRAVMTVSVQDTVVDTCSNQGLKIGYKSMVFLGSQMKLDGEREGVFRLDYIFGYQVKKDFSIGLGIGVRRYSSCSVLVPVFADFRVNFIEKKLSPFFAFGAGYAIDTNSDLKGGGILMNPSVGVTLMISHKKALHLGIAYEWQELNGVSYGHSSDKDSIGFYVGLSI